MMHKAWSSIEEVPYCFSRSYVKFQGHMALKIVEFDPNWAFPDSNSSLNSPMATKCCTKLETAKERCPIVFQGHPSNFKVTRDKTSPILTQIGRFRTIGRSQLSNPSDLPCLWHTTIHPYPDLNDSSTLNAVVLSLYYLFTIKESSQNINDLFGLHFSIILVCIHGVLLEDLFQVFTQYLGTHWISLLEMIWLVCLSHKTLLSNAAQYCYFMPLLVLMAMVIVSSVCPSSWKQYHLKSLRI